MSIEADGATTTVYIQQVDSTLYYKFNQGQWIEITSYPIMITNTNADKSNNILKILFSTNLTLTSSNQKIQVASGGIQIGDTSLNQDGSKATILVDGITDYAGFIDSSGVFDTVSIYNIHVTAINGSTLAENGGWVGQANYGAGGTNYYIINCSSDGDIPVGGGGIVGVNAAWVLNSPSTDLTIVGCWSSGSIGGAGGGIVGDSAGLSGGTLEIIGCYSTGAISGNGAGGIVGANSVSTVIEKCYSEGVISGNNAGGIMGANAGIDSVTIEKCYSRGGIEGSNAGGICGSLGTGSELLTVTITNCYSTGNLLSSGTKYNGGICGLLLPYNSGEINLTITHCYAVGTCDSIGYMIGNRTTINGTNSSPSQFILANNYSEAGSVGGTPGTWSDTHAGITLTGTPTLSPDAGSTWASLSSGTAYELVNFGVTPYQLQTVNGTTIVQSYSQSVQQGDKTVESVFADASGNVFVILKKTGGSSSSYPTITISAQTGQISTSRETETGTYALTVRSAGVYSITNFLVTVTDFVSSTSTLRRQQYDFETYNNIRVGERLVRERLENSNARFNSFADYYKYIKALHRM